MRKLLITAISGLALIGAAVSSFAQGTITWNNSPSSTPAAFVDYFGVDTGQVTGPSGTYEYGLYVGAAGDTSIFQMTLVATYFNSSAAPAKGLIQGGQVTLPSGYPNGTAIADIVAGWTAADGNNYLTAIAVNGNDYEGISAVGSVTPNSPAGQVFGHGAGQITGLTLYNLTDEPEPSTIALCSLGAATMLLFRRKKQ
jgi:hypothetical protein